MGGFTEQPERRCRCPGCGHGLCTQPHFPGQPKKQPARSLGLLRGFRLFLLPGPLGDTSPHTFSLQPHPTSFTLKVHWTPEQRGS